MVCYPPSGYIIFSLKKLKFYEGRKPRPRYEGWGAGVGQPLNNIAGSAAILLLLDLLICYPLVKLYKTYTRIVGFQ